MKNKKLNIIVSIIISIITASLFIPIRTTGGIANKSFYGKTNIFNINNSFCSDCYNTEILWHFIIIEIILVFTISLIILNFIDKRRKTNE